MLSSAKQSEMTGDFDVEQKPQLCGFGLDSNRSKEPSDESTSKQHFNFPGSFQSNGPKSNCRGDVTTEQNPDNEGSLCRQGLGDQKNVQNKIASNSPYCNEQLLCSMASDHMESNIESLKTMTLDVAKPRDGPFTAAPVDSNPFGFERSHSAQKFDCYNLMGDAAHVNANSKSRSTPESSSGIDTAYASSHPRSQLLIENPSSTGDSHSSAPYWGNPGGGQQDDNGAQVGLSLNNLSPLLTNLLFQQSTNASPSNGLQPNSLSSSAVVAKRAITGGHQGIRPPQSRPPGWNPTTTNAFESNFLSNADQPVINPNTTSGLTTSKPPGWMGNFPSQGTNSYPWSSGQQGSFKPSFGDINPSGFPSGNATRFGINANFGSTSSNGFPKGSTLSNQASLYSMFPKRPTHRMMAHWQQQQQHQQQFQQVPGSILNKQHSSDFSGSSPFGAQDGMPSTMSQKLQHGQFGPLSSNVGGSSLSNNLMTSNSDSLGSEKMGGLDSFRGNYPMDPHLFEFMKPMESPGNAPPALLDDMAFNNISGMENYHSNLHSLPNMQQPRSGMMQSVMQNQGMHGIPNTYSSLSGVPPREEGYSRKVFVGGLPPDIDEEEITTAFRRFGGLIVDWPHKTESKAYFPPKGYCFLLFQEEHSVQDLINACIVDEGKYYWCVSSPTMKDKPVQIRPWNLADSDFVMDGSQTLDPRKTIFVGGVPRPLRAIELALIMDRLYGGVCYAGIDIDPELKYPKGAGRVAFSNQQSYIAAISARFVQLQHNDIDKRVEVKPYVLDNQMCDECQGARCGGKFAPLFCANVTCLQYYCEQCWIQIHSRQGREYHKPLVKEGAERPRPALYRW